MTTFDPSRLSGCEQMEFPWMSSAAVSPVRTSAAPELDMGLMASVQVFGGSSRDLFASYDPDTRWWKTSQPSLTGDWEQFSETFPNAGTMRSGRLYRRAPWVPHTCDSACSLWPTPTASMDGRGFGIPLHNRSGRYRQSTISRVHALVGAHGWRIHPNFTEALMGLPLDWTATEP